MLSQLRLVRASLLITGLALSIIACGGGGGGGGGPGPGGPGGPGGPPSPPPPPPPPPVPPVAPKIQSYGVKGTTTVNATCTLDGVADSDGMADLVFTIKIPVSDLVAQDLNDTANFQAQSSTQTTTQVIGISAVAP